MIMLPGMIASFKGLVLVIEGLGLASKGTGAALLGTYGLVAGLVSVTAVAGYFIWQGLDKYIDSIRQSFDDSMSTLEKWKAIITDITYMLSQLTPVGVIMKKLGLIQLPSFQQGGYMKRSGAALVGEAGPELLQLPTGARVTPMSQAGGMGAGGGGATLNFNAPMNFGAGLDARKAAREFTEELRRIMGAQGQRLGALAS